MYALSAAWGLPRGSPERRSQPEPALRCTGAVWLYSILMPRLVLNRRQNYGNHVLEGRPEGEVAYLPPDGERRFVPWLEFIERDRASALESTRPVRLADITRIGEGDAASAQWRDVPPGRYVHGCLTARGAFAVYDTSVALVDGPGKA